MCTAAILAGGTGRRLGGVPKPLIALGGRRIIDRQLAALRTVVSHVGLVTAGPDQFADLGLPIWPDERPGSGPLGGILTALVNTPSTRTLVIAGDMPFVTSSFLRYLVQAGDGVDVAVPRTRDGYQPLCASYDRACIETIRRHLDEGAWAVHRLFDDVRVREIDMTDRTGLDPHGTLFFNVNTPEDVARGQAIAVESPGERLDSDDDS